MPHARSAGMSTVRSSDAEEKRSCGAIARQRWSAASNAAWFGKPEDVLRVYVVLRQEIFQVHASPLSALLSGL